MVLIYTFRGGIHMEEYKYTAGSPIEKMPAPNRVYVPLSQHIGAPCTATVKKDDIVDKGQIIGVVEKGLGCPVHAPVSGKVLAIEEVYTPMGRKVARVVIENDGEERLCETITKKENAVAEIKPIMYQAKLSDNSKKLLDVIQKSRMQNAGMKVGG